MPRAEGIEYIFGVPGEEGADFTGQGTYTFGRHTDLSFDNPDWPKLAEAFGWNGYTCTRSEDLRGVLDASFEADGPSLVVIPIDYRENGLLTQKLGGRPHCESVGQSP